MIKHALFKVAGTLGAWSITRRLTLGAPRIFMLHRFSSQAKPRATHADELVLFIRRVRAEFDFLTVREILARNTERGARRRPLAAITIDDGYEDFYSVALPILHELKVPATLYATAGFIDRQCWMWWDALRYLLDLHPPGMLSLEAGGQQFRIELRDAPSRDSAWSQLADLLVQDNGARRHVLDQLQAHLGQSLPVEPTEEYSAMNWSQLREAAQNGIEIGGHSMTHAYLPAMDAQGLEYEITAAKAMIEAQLDQELTTFAYPNGMHYDHSPEVVKQVRLAGFKAAVVAYAAPFDVGRAYQIGRWSTHSESSQLENILSGASELKLRLSAP